MTQDRIFHFCGQCVSKVEHTFSFLQCRGLSYGQGVFETLAVLKGQIILESEHLARMQKGALVLKLDFVLELAKVLVADFLCHQPESGVLKLTLLAGQNSLGRSRGYGVLGSTPSLFILHFSPLPQTLLFQRLCRIPAPFFPWPAALVGLKMVSAMQYVHWASYALQQGADQGALFDHRGYLIECTSSNIVIYDKCGQWYTPFIDCAGVRGVLRQVLIAQGIIFEKNLLEFDLINARQVYIINSLRGFQRIVSYDGLESTRTWSEDACDQHTQFFEAHIKSIFASSEAVKK